MNTWLPIHMKEDTDKHDVLATLQRVGAEYAILSLDHIILSAKRDVYEKSLAPFAEIIPFLRENGYKVGIYFWSLWLTDIAPDELVQEVMLNAKGEPRVAHTALNSNEKRDSGFLCPTSPKIQIMLDIIHCAASLSPDVILLNDDLGYATYLNSLGCFCERHMTQIREYLGREITREELCRTVAYGESNDVRRAWLALQGLAMEQYAERIRRTIDTVDSSIRCGLCCVMSNWQADGMDMLRMAKLLAGNTKPLLRLIGAPYWAAKKSWGNRLQHTVELIRMQSAWMADTGVELIAEGDVYPRPRHEVPASFLEHYHTALCAASCCDGILKFMLDYTASFLYEDGYVARHVKNGTVYTELERLFSHKSEAGVRVYEYMNTAADADLTGLNKPEEYAANLFFSPAARFLVDNSVPTTYQGYGTAGIVFGENARHLPDEALDHGLILDIRAAKILMKRGVDVGLTSVGNVLLNNYLYFPAENERTLSNYRGAAAHEIVPKPEARVLTFSASGEKRYADTIEYENALGQRFLIYAFDAALVRETRYRNYCTQKQLVSSIQWLSRQKMPVVCTGHPDLYILCKKDEDGMAIGLWNMFADEILQPEILLSEAYESVEALGCYAELNGNRLRLSDLPAYGFAFLHVK